MKNKQKQMKTEMEKVKNAKVTQAAQAEIDKALATVNAQMEDVKGNSQNYFLFVCLFVSILFTLILCNTAPSGPTVLGDVKKICRLNPLLK